MSYFDVISLVNIEKLPQIPKNGKNKRNANIHRKADL